MAKPAATGAKTSSPPTSHARAPYIYINDPSGKRSDIVETVASKIPRVVTEVAVRDGKGSIFFQNRKETPNPMDTSVYIFTDREEDPKIASQTARAYHGTAVTHGRNFVSVQLNQGPTSATEDKVNWGANHFDVDVSNLLANAASQALHRWLRTVLTVPEVLHVTPVAEMRLIDTKNFPDHAYCPLIWTHKQPKDVKIQHVVLILTKPQVKPGRRIEWKVIDCTGEALYYFRYKGPGSEFTWNWVQALKPGQRVALARQQMVRVEESKQAVVLKSPFRVLGSCVTGAGIVVRNTGRALVSLGNKLHMGPRGGKWVHPDDVDKKTKAAKQKTKKDKKTKAQVDQPKSEKDDIKTVADKDEKALWRDEDNDASTTAGSVVDENEKRDLD